MGLFSHLTDGAFPIGARVWLFSSWSPPASGHYRNFTQDEFSVVNVISEYPVQRMEIGCLQCFPKQIALGCPMSVATTGCSCPNVLALGAELLAQENNCAKSGLSTGSVNEAIVLGKHCIDWYRVQRGRNPEAKPYIFSEIETFWKVSPWRRCYANPQRENRRRGRLPCQCRYRYVWWSWAASLVAAGLSPWAKQPVHPISRLRCVPCSA